MMTDAQKEVRNDFRKYLRTEKGIKSSSLSSMMDAMDNHLSDLLQRCGTTLRMPIYEDIFSVGELQGYLSMLQSDEDVLAAPYGYITTIALQHYIAFFCKTHDVEPEEDPQVTLTEGEEAELKGIRYERNPIARKKCIEHYGCKCFVCGFDFEKTYGELGKGFIEVHHIVPVSQRGGAYEVDPIRDLRPLCSNCHSMVHRKNGQVLSISSLQEILSE